MREFFLDAGAVGGDGSFESQYGSFAELFANETMESGDVVRAKGIFYEDLLIDQSLAVFKILRQDGEAQPKLRPCSLAVFDTVHSAAGTYDVLKTDAIYTTKPTELVQDYETEDANGLYGQGNGSGFNVHTTATLMGAANTEMGANLGRWFWNVNDSRVYVSVLKGERNADHLWYATDTGITTSNGSVFQMTGSWGHVTIDLDTCLGTRATADQEGNGMDIAASFVTLTLVSPNIQGCNFHHYVSRGSTHGTIIIDTTHGRGLIASARGNNDGMVTLFAGSVFNGGSVVGDIDCWQYRWRDVNGNVYQDGNIKGFGTHNTGGAVPAMGIIFDRCTTKRDPLAGIHNDPAFTCTAGGTQHVVPTTPGEISQYSVLLRDCDFEGGVNIGGGANATISVFNQRSKHWGDLSLVDASTMAGLGHMAVSSGASSQTHYHEESVTVAFELNDVINRALNSAAAAGSEYSNEGGSKMVLGNGYVNSPCLYNFNTSTTRVEIKGTSHDCENEEAIHLFRGALNPDSMILADNLYSTNLNSSAHPASGTNLVTGGGSIKSVNDINGEFDTAPVYLDTDTLEPDEATRAVKSITKASGPLGINGNPFDGTYGSHQYRPLRRARGRGRDRRAVAMR